LLIADIVLLICNLTEVSTWQ